MSTITGNNFLIDNKKLFALRTNTYTNVAIGSNGYAAIAIPQTPTGYGLVDVRINDFDKTPLSLAYNSSGAGTLYIVGTPNETYAMVDVAFIYVKAELIQFVS